MAATATPLGPARHQPELWLVRHGETEWAMAGRHTGRTDVPLTATGRAQGQAIARRLAGHEFRRVWSSPMQRALETCRIAGFADRVEMVDDLREWDYGADEGRTTAEIQRARPGWSLWRDGPLGGETLRGLSRRADRIVARVRAGQGDVLCFGHGHCLRVVAARWLGLSPVEGRVFALDPGAISILGWEHDAPVIDRWNEGGEG